MKYERLLAGKALEDHGAPARAVDVWLDSSAFIDDEATKDCKDSCAQALLPVEERVRPFCFLHGVPGTGKTVAAVAGLGEAVAEAFRKQRAGGLDMSRVRTHLPKQEAITPERVRRVLGLDWETYLANEKIQPGVCSAQVREAYAQEAGWDFALCPLSFAFWRATTTARQQSFGREAEARIEHASTCDVLVVDDMGAETVSERGPWLSIIDEVVDARYSRSLVTVITTNLAMPEFCARYQTRVLDRFRELGRLRKSTTQSRRGARKEGEK